MPLRSRDWSFLLIAASCILLTTVCFFWLADDPPSSPQGANGGNRPPAVEAGGVPQASKPGPAGGNSGRRVQPIKIRYPNVQSQRKIAAFPELQQAFNALRTQVIALERSKLAVKEQRTTGPWEVTVFEITQPTVDELNSVYSGLTRLREANASDPQRSAVVGEEIELFMQQYLSYPHPGKILLVTRNTETQAIRVFEYFSNDPSRKLLNEQGGMIRYGDDYASEDADAYRSNTSWARERYPMLPDLIPKSP